MTVPDDDDVWSAFVQAMRKHPLCITTMAAAADYLQERGDPRWEPLAWMAEYGKTGNPNGFDSGYWGEHNRNKARRSRIALHWLRSCQLTSIMTVIDERLHLLETWAVADAVFRAEWLAVPDVEKSEVV